MPREEEPEEEVAPVDESDNELVRQTDEEEGPHEDDELEAAGTVLLPLTPLRVSTCEVPQAFHMFLFLTNVQ